MSAALLSFFLVLASMSPTADSGVRFVEKFLGNAAFEAWHPGTGEVLFTRRDERGVLQLYSVPENSRNPEAQKKCLSRGPARAIGIDAGLITRLHKGASD